MAFDPRRRIGLLVMLAAGVAFYLSVAPKVPKDQAIHFVLGDASARVTELDVRYAPASVAKNDTILAEDWTREATFRFPVGSAPRIVTHEPRLADGDYVVEIEIQTPPQRASLRRKVSLQGGTTSIDLSEAVPR